MKLNNLSREELIAFAESCLKDVQETKELARQAVQLANSYKDDALRAITEAIEILERYTVLKAAYDKIISEKKGF